MPLTRGGLPFRRKVHRDSNGAAPSGAAPIFFPSGEPLIEKRGLDAGGQRAARTYAVLDASIAMVIIFTFLAKGNTPMALVFVALNSVAQMLLIPIYARLLIGDVRFDVWVVAQSVVLYLGLPLVLGVATRVLVVRRRGEAGMDALKPTLNGVSILGLLFTLIVMFALKGDLILQRPGIVVEMAIPMSLFFVAMFFVVLTVAWRLGFPYRDAVAVAFSATGRDFEIAIAIAITAFSPTVALATVVGPLVEVPVMLFLVWSAMRLTSRMFGVPPLPVTAAGPPAP